MGCVAVKEREGVRAELMAVAELEGELMAAVGLEGVKAMLMAAGLSGLARLYIDDTKYC